MEALAMRLALAATGAYLPGLQKCRVDDIIVFGDDFAARVIGRGEGGDIAVWFINPEKTMRWSRALILKIHCHVMAQCLCHPIFLGLTG